MSDAHDTTETTAGDTTENNAEDLAAALVDAFGRFGPAWLRHVKALAASDVLSPSRIRLLAELHKAGRPLIMARLTDALGVTPRAVTAIVDSMELDRLVRRAPHPSDRRATCIELTPDGERALRTCHGPRLAAMAEIFRELAEDDQRALLRGLRTLTEALVRRERERAGASGSSRRGTVRGPE